MSEVSRVQDGWSSHGWWIGDGEAPDDGPDLVARCGGPGMCPVCKSEKAALVSRVQEPDQWPCTKPRVRTHPGGGGLLPEVDQCTHDLCRPPGPTVALDAPERTGDDVHRDLDQVVAKLASKLAADPSPTRERPRDYATAYASLHEVVRAFLAGERNAKYLRRMHAEIEADLTQPAPTSEWACERCGSPRWAGWRNGPEHEGWPRKAQCVPCGHVQELPLSEVSRG